MVRVFACRLLFNVCCLLVVVQYVLLGVSCLPLVVCLGVVFVFKVTWCLLFVVCCSWLVVNVCYVMLVVCS